MSSARSHQPPNYPGFRAVRHAAHITPAHEHEAPYGRTCRAAAVARPARARRCVEPSPLMKTAAFAGLPSLSRPRGCPRIQGRDKLGNPARTRAVFTAEQLASVIPGEASRPPPAPCLARIWSIGDRPCIASHPGRFAILPDCTYNPFGTAAVHARATVSQACQDRPNPDIAANPLQQSPCFPFVPQCDRVYVHSDQSLAVTLGGRCRRTGEIDVRHGALGAPGWGSPERRPSALPLAPSQGAVPDAARPASNGGLHDGFRLSSQWAGVTSLASPFTAGGATPPAGYLERVARRRDPVGGPGPARGGRARDPGPARAHLNPVRVAQPGRNRARGAPAVAAAGTATARGQGRADFDHAPGRRRGR